ncbi:DMT family transporter [Granulicella sp. WH15]|nr:DMT family transporter [Granulicella sp. WH15]
MRRLSSERLAQVLLLGVVAVWGATFVVVKDALRDASPLVFNVIRMGLATAALVAMHRRALRRVSVGQVLKGAAVGSFLAAGYQLQTLGLARTTAAKSALLTGLVVIFVPILTTVPTLRPAGTARPGAFTAAGVVLAFVGLVLLTTPPGTVAANIFSSIGLGDLLTLGCALAFAGHLLMLAHVSRGFADGPQTESGVLATLQIGAATVAMLLTLPLEGAHHLVWTPRLVVALGVTSLLGTAAAFTVQSYAQAHLPPTQTALLLTLEPVFAWVTSMVVLGERMGMRSALGAGLILAGIATIELLGQATEIPA